MADVHSLNYNIATNNPWQAVWRLSRCMKKAGWTYKASGDGSSLKDTTGIASNDLWGGNADPLLDTFPGWFTVPAWILFEGCSTLRIPITSAPTGNFLRGENVKQAFTNAEGEFLGYVIDAAGTTGYLVVMPRVAGSGFDRWGWNNTCAITGDSSGATVVQNGFVIEYVHQIVLWKQNGSKDQGTIYCQCVDAIWEPSELFSSRLTAAGCTATVPPGGGGTGNGFPTIAYVVLGTGGTLAPGLWNCQGATGSFGNVQIVATNVTPGSGVSADGTLWMAIANANMGTFAPYQCYSFLGFMRLDNQEEGDVDPWVWVVPNFNSYSVSNRTVNTSTATSPDHLSLSSGYWHTYAWTRGWRKRGLTGGSYCEYEAHVKGRFSTTSRVELNPLDREVTACDLQRTYVGQPVFVEGVMFGLKQSKGTFRWIRMVQGGSTGDMYASNKWAQMSHHSGAVLLGPWDGSTTPLWS